MGQRPPICGELLGYTVQSPTDRAMPLASLPPDIDRQTERVNTVAELYFCGFINYLQDNRDGWLAIAEFTGNNTASETTIMSPFFVNRGFNPGFSTDVVSTRPDEDQHGRMVAQALRNKHDAVRNENLSEQDK